MRYDPIIIESIAMDVHTMVEVANEFPIVIVQKLSNRYPQVPKSEVQREVSDYLEFKKKIERCEKIGHSWVVESYGGPESGWESGYCKKCGYSFEHTLY